MSMPPKYANRPDLAAAYEMGRVDTIASFMAGRPAAECLVQVSGAARTRHSWFLTPRTTDGDLFKLLGIDPEVWRKRPGAFQQRPVLVLPLSETTITPSIV